MILDNALAHSVLLDNGFKRNLKLLKPYTRRYVFDADASHKHGRFTADDIEIVCRNARYAVRPFPNTYIEIDNVASLTGSHHTPFPDTAERLGFWWTASGHVFALAGNDHKAEFNPFVYLDKTSAEAENLIGRYFENHSAKNYAEFKTMLMIGLHPDNTQSEVHAYAPLLTSLYEVGLTSGIIPFNLLDIWFQECLGTLKRALATLMLLDDRIKRRIVNVPARQKIVGGKLRGIAKHELVTIDLDVPVIHNIYSQHLGHHETPLQHEVSDHWVTYDLSSQCQHDWKPFHSDTADRRDIKQGHDKPLLRQVCKLCGGRRTRKPGFIKGDASKGSTVGKRQFRVVASKEKEIIKKEKGNA